MKRSILISIVMSVVLLTASLVLIFIYVVNQPQPIAVCSYGSKMSPGEEGSNFLCSEPHISIKNVTQKPVYNVNVTIICYYGDTTTSTEHTKVINVVYPKESMESNSIDSNRECIEVDFNICSLGSPYPTSYELFINGKYIDEMTLQQPFPDAPE